MQEEYLWQGVQYERGGQRQKSEEKTGALIDTDVWGSKIERSVQIA
jgi:hypothetical protein